MQPTEKSGLQGNLKGRNSLPSSNPVRKAQPDEYLGETMQPKKNFFVRVIPSLLSASRIQGSMINFNDVHGRDDPLKAEVARLQALLITKDDEIRNLRSRMTMRESEMSNLYHSQIPGGNTVELEALIARLRAENDELRSQLAAAKERISVMGVDYDALLAILREKDEGLNLFGEEIIKLRRDIQVSESQSHEYEIRCSTFAVESEKRLNDLDEAKRSIARLEIQLNGMRSEKDAFYSKGNDDIQIYTNELERLREELKERDIELSLAHREILSHRELERRRIEQEKDVELLVEEISNLRIRIGNLEDDNLAMHRENQRLLMSQQGMETLPSDHYEVLQENQRLRDRILESDYELQQTTSKFEQTRVNDIALIRLENANQVDHLKDQIKFYSESAQRLEAEMESLFQENSALLLRLQSHGATDMLPLIDEIKSLRSRLAEKESEVKLMRDGPVRDIKLLANTLIEKEETIRRLTRELQSPAQPLVGSFTQTVNLKRSENALNSPRKQGQLSMGLENLLREKDEEIVKLKIENSDLREEIRGLELVGASEMNANTITTFRRKSTFAVGMPRGHSVHASDLSSVDDGSVNQGEGRVNQVPLRESIGFPPRFTQNSRFSSFKERTVSIGGKSLGGRASIMAEKKASIRASVRRSFASDTYLAAKEENLEFHRDEVERLKKEMRINENETLRLKAEIKTLRLERGNADSLITRLRESEAQLLSKLNSQISNNPSNSQFSVSSEELLRVKQDCGKLVERIDEQRREKAILEDDISRLSELVESLSRAHETKNREIENLRSQLTFLQESFSEGKSLESENAKLRFLLEEKLSEIDELSLALNSIRQHDVDYRSKIEFDYTSIIEKLRADLMSKEAQIGQLSTLLSTREEDIINVVNELKRFKIESESAFVKLDSREEELLRLKEEFRFINSSHQNELSRLKSQFSEKDQFELASLRNTLISRDNELSSLRNQIYDRESEINRMKLSTLNRQQSNVLVPIENYEFERKELTRLRETMAYKERELLELRSKPDSAIAIREAAELRDRLTMKESELTSLYSKVRLLEEALMTAESNSGQFEAMKAQIKELLEEREVILYERDRLIASLDSVNRHHANALKERDLFESQKENLKRRLDSYEHVIAGRMMGGDYEAMEAKLVDTDLNCLELKSQVESLSARNGNLERERNELRKEKDDMLSKRSWETPLVYEKETIRREVRILNEKIESLETMLREKNSYISSLEAAQMSFNFIEEGVQADFGEKENYGYGTRRVSAVIPEVKERAATIGGNRLSMNNRTSAMSRTASVAEIQEKIMRRASVREQEGDLTRKFTEQLNTFPNRQPSVANRNRMASVAEVLAEDGMNMRIRENELKLRSLEEELSSREVDNQKLRFEITRKNELMAQLERVIAMRETQIKEIESSTRLNTTSTTEEILRAKDKRTRELENALLHRDARVLELEREIMALRRGRFGTGINSMASSISLPQPGNPEFDDRLVLLADEVLRLKNLLGRVVNEEGFGSTFDESSLSHMYTSRHIDVAKKEAELNRILELMGMSESDLRRIREELLNKENEVIQRENYLEEQLTQVYSSYPDLCTDNNPTSFILKIKMVYEQLAYYKDLATKLTALDRNRVEHINNIVKELQFLQSKTVNAKQTEIELSKLKLFCDILERRKYQEVEEAQEAAERAKLELLHEGIPTVELITASSPSESNVERVSTLVEELNIANHKIQTLELKRDAHFNEISNLQKSLENLKSNFEEQRRLVRQAEERARIAEEETLRTKILEIENSSMKSIEAAYNRLLEENEYLKARVDTLTSSMQSNRQEWISAAESARQWLLTEQEGLKAEERGYWEKQQNSLKHQITLLEQELVSRVVGEAQMIENEREVERLITRNDSLETQMLHLRNETIRLEALLSEYKEKAYELEALKRSLKNANEKNQELHKDLRERVIECDEKSAKIFVLEHSLEELTSKLDTLNKLNTDSTKEKEALNEALSSLNFEVDRISTTVKVRNNEIESLKREKDQLLKERTSFVQEFLEKNVGEELRFDEKLEDSYNERIRTLIETRNSLQEILVSKELEEGHFRKREEQYLAIISGKQAKLVELQNQVEILSANVYDSQHIYSSTIQEARSTFHHRFMAEIEKIKESSMKQMKNMKNHLDSVTTQNSHLEDELSTLGQEHQKLLSLYRSCDKEKNELALKVNHLNELFRYQSEEMKAKLEANFNCYWEEQTRNLQRAFETEKINLQSSVNITKNQNDSLLKNLEKLQNSINRQEYENQKLIQTHLASATAFADSNKSFQLRIDELHAFNALVSGVLEKVSITNSEMEIGVSKDVESTFEEFTVEVTDLVKGTLDEFSSYTGTSIPEQIRVRVEEKKSSWKRRCDNRLSNIKLMFTSFQREFNAILQELVNKAQDESQRLKTELKEKKEENELNSIELVTRQYEERIKGFKGEISELERENSKLLQKSVIALEELQLKDVEIRSKSQEIEQHDIFQRQKIKDVQEKIKTIVNQHESAESKLEENERTAYESNISHLKSRIIELEKSQKTLFNKYISLQQSNTNKQKDFASSDKIEAAAFKVQIEVLSEEVESLKDQIQSLENERKVHLAQLKNCKSTIETQKAVIEQLYSSLSSKAELS